MEGRAREAAGVQVSLTTGAASKYFHYRVN
jgi:hypothetical protein